jgi:metal-sulfur cluster biosynthetic enzyme
VGAQAAGHDGDVEHQGHIGERELGEIDDDIGLGSDRAREGRSPDPLRVAVLVTAAAKGGRLVIEVDDRETLVNDSGGCHAGLAKSRWLAPTTRLKRRRLAAMATVDEVTDALRDVIDPELGLDFVELGLIYDVEVQDGNVRVTYTLTSPGCPIGPQVSEQIEEFVSELDGVVQVEPTMTFSPPWTPERMSEDAKFALGF